jgi:hypothetical protein
MQSVDVKTNSLWRVLNTPIPNPIAYWFKNEFAPRMPPKWKRLFYIGSVIALTSFMDKPDFLLFSKINDMLGMTYTGTNLWIPKFIRDSIWKPILSDSIELGGKSVPVTCLDKCEINNAELEQMATYFLERTPSWITYAPGEYMKRDLMTCLSQLFEKKFDTSLA